MPVNPHPLAHASAKPFDRTAVLPDSTASTKPKVLVVEDETPLRMLVTDILEGEDLDVHSVASADEALPLIDNSFDLVLSDIMMPGTSGMELLQTIKQRNNSVEVILMTGFPKVEAAVTAMKFGAFDYITKPFDIAHLRERVNAALDHRKSTAGMTLTQDHAKSTSTRYIAGYRILETLGEGQMGLVLKGEKNGTHYAIKIIKNQVGGSARNEAVQRFFKEADAASRLNHPCVIHTFEHGYAREENIPYLVMEYFPGMPLKRHLNSPELKLPLKVRIIRDLASALAATHACDVIHRDIKPDNVMISGAPDWKVKLTDFGVAQLPDSDITNISRIVGTPYYLSPEGFSCPKVDHRADLYSLGVLAYEFWLGQKPFEAMNLSALGFKMQTENPPEPIKLNNSFPVALQLILERLLKKRPEGRYAQATDLVNDLNLWIDAQTGRQTLPTLRATWNTLR